MSALTRILNNQIYSKTIIASQKIADGTITGPLFSSNVTVPGDFLITGNLFVLGSSQTTTVASTNTYVNDPLIVLNNGFAGSNTYDEGLIFNRGTGENQAFIWSETFKEFRLVATSETGTTYGNITVSDLANLSVRHFYTKGTNTTNGNVNQTGTGQFGVQVAGNIALNGPYLTTSQGNISVFNVGATQINLGGEANLSIGASVGTTAIRNATLSLPFGTALTTGQSTFNLLNTTATTVNAFGAATALNLGAGSGIATVNNANIWLPNATTVGNGQDAVTLFSLPATVTAFGSGTVVTLGASSGDLVIRNPFVDSTQSTLTLFNANVTTLNFAGAGTTINVGANSGTLTIGNPTVVGTQSTQNLYNTTATTMNFAGAATALTMGYTTGLASIRNQVINFPNATSLITDQSSLNVFNANVTTLNLAGAAEAITIGATTGTATIRNAITALTGRANVNSTVDATTKTNAAFTVAGGAGIAKTLIVGEGLFANSSSASTTTDTGAIVVPNGGVGISGNLNVGGNALVNGPTTINNTLSTTGITRLYNTTNTTQTHDTGALQVDGGASISKDLWVGGNVYAGNIFGTQQQIITVKDPLLYLEAGNTYPYNYDIGVYSNFVGPNSIDNTGNVYQHTAVIRDNSDNTWKFVSNVRSEPTGGSLPIDSDTIYDPVRAGNLTLVRTDDATSATTGSFKTAGGAGIGGNIFHTGTRLETSASNYIFASTPTTVDAFKAATDLEIGATSGTLLINNPTVVGSQTTQALFNTVADTINFGRAANITMGINAGTTTVQGNLTVQSVRKSTAYNNGALTLSGGLGVDGNIFINDSYIDTAQSSLILAGTPTTVDAFKAATTLNVGANSGTLTIGNPTVVGTQTTQALYNTVATTINAFGVANVTMGVSGVGYTSIRTSNIWLPYATSIDGTQTTINLFSNTATSVNAFNAATDIEIGAIDGQILINNGTLQLPNAYNVVFGNTTVAFGNTNITTLNAFGSATSIRMGATTGTTTVRNSLAADGVIYGNSTGASANTTTGALVVKGGVGFGSNLFVANGAIINYSQTSENFTVRGKVTTTLIHADSNYGAVIIGGSNATPTLGATLKVNGVDSLMLPYGSTSDRPSNSGNVDLAGMIRFNNTINNMEFYDGTQWQVTGSTFTVITDRQFQGNVAGGYGNVDGTNTTFTIQANATTSSTIVSINGVMQFPVLAYSITGSTLTFTEPPAPNDVIDVRILTTTSTVGSLASGNGYNQFLADGTGSSIWTGIVSTTERVLIDPVGEINILAGSKLTYDQTVINIPTTSAATQIATWSQTSYTSAKYQIQAKVGSTNMETYEALVLTDGAGNAYINTYGIVNNGTSFGTLSANVVSGNVRVYFTSTIAQANVKAFGTYIV